MPNRRLPALVGVALVLAGAVIAGCGGAGGAAAVDGEVLCPPPDFAIDGAVDVAARCRQMVAVADERLGLLHWPITNVDVRWNVCPPGARCRFLQLSQAWVLYWFSNGEPLMIHVHPRAQGDVGGIDLVAEAPEPLPDWLLKELDARNAGKQPT